MGNTELARPGTILVLKRRGSLGEVQKARKCEATCAFAGARCTPGELTVLNQRQAELRQRSFKGKRPWGRFPRGLTRLPPLSNGGALVCSAGHLLTFVPPTPITPHPLLTPGSPRWDRSPRRPPSRACPVPSSASQAAEQGPLLPPGVRSETCRVPERPAQCSTLPAFTRLGQEKRP